MHFWSLIRSCLTWF